MRGVYIVSFAHSINVNFTGYASVLLGLLWQQSSSFCNIHVYAPCAVYAYVMEVLWIVVFFSKNRRIKPLKCYKYKRFQKIFKYVIINGDIFCMKCLVQYIGSKQSNNLRYMIHMCRIFTLIVVYYLGFHITLKQLLLLMKPEN